MCIFTRILRQASPKCPIIWLHQGEALDIAVPSPVPISSWLIHPQRAPLLLEADMLTASSPEKLPDFLIATINKLLLCFQRGKVGVPGFLLAGVHFSEQISVMSGYALWEQPSFSDELREVKPWRRMPAPLHVSRGVPWTEGWVSVKRLLDLGVTWQKIKNHFRAGIGICNNKGIKGWKFGLVIERELLLVNIVPFSFAASEGLSVKLFVSFTFFLPCTCSCTFLSFYLPRSLHLSKMAFILSFLCSDGKCNPFCIFFFLLFCHF